MKKVYIALLIALVSLLSACTTRDANQSDLTNWNEEKVYAFLNEVQQHINKMPVETKSREKIIEQYESYFSPELSEAIFNSLYIETEDGWKIPDGDAGYIFFVPSRGTDDSEVKIEFNKDFISIKETYEMGMYKEIEYIIRNIGKPAITEWIQKLG